MSNTNFFNRPNRKILIQPNPRLVVQAFLVFSSSSSNAELYGVYASKSAAMCKVIQLKEDILGYPHISARTLKRHELEQHLDADITQAQFEKWGLETISIDGVEYQA